MKWREREREREEGLEEAKVIMVMIEFKASVIVCCNYSSFSVVGCAMCAV